MGRRHALLLTCAAFALAPALAPAADELRGRSLYEGRCGACHAESVHGRVNRSARDFDAVRRWVSRWSDNLRLGWTAEEVDDVTAYLNAKYYRYPCPAGACRALTQRSRSPGNTARFPG